MSTKWTPKRTVEECTAIMTAPGGIWETEDKVIKGRPVRVFKNLPTSLREFWEGTRAFGKATYIVYEGESMTYAETHARVEAIAALLRSHGVGKGTAVAIVMRNYPEWICAFWAIHSLGAISVAVNAWLGVVPLTFCLTHAEATVAIVDEERAAVLAPVLPELSAAGCKRVFVVRAKSVPKGMESFEAAVKPFEGKTKPTTTAGIHADEPACIFFTSGTTGLPKAVISTQRMYLTNFLLTRISSSRALLRNGESLPVPDPNAPQSGVLLTVPLFHVTGNQSLLALPTGTGGKVVLMYKFALPDAVALIRKEKITLAGGVPSMVLQLIESGLGSTSTLTAFSFGGAPAPENLPTSLRKYMGNAVSASQAYGLTETNAIITSHAGEDYLARPGSCGLPTMVNDFKIIDTAGASLPANGVGEIVVRGPNVAEGYYKNQAATEEAFTSDGWFRTGDIGYLDDGGWLFILDRAKEIIIRGGENISTITVENALYSDERVKEAAVVPLKDYMLGELVGAIVTVKEAHRSNPPTEESLTALVRSLLPKHCTPVMVIISYGEILRNVNGKIMKKELKVELNKVWEERNKGTKAVAKL